MVSIHYNDVIMSVIASQITSPTIVYSTVYSGADKRKHQSSASLAFSRGIHRGPVNSPHKWPEKGKNVSIWWRHHVHSSSHLITRWFMWCSALAMLHPVTAYKDCLEECAVLGLNVPLVYLLLLLLMYYIIIMIASITDMFMSMATPLEQHI